MRAFVLLASITLWSSACAARVGGQVSTPAATAPSPALAPAPPVASVLPGSSSSTDPQPLIEAALRDAAAHLSVSPADLHVDQVDARQWGDSSLGCPRPGLMYSQIVTPGYFIVISGAGKQLEYHTDARSEVVLCQER